MHHETKHLMVPEILVPKSLCFWLTKLAKPLEPLNQYLGNHKVLSLKTHIKMLRIENSFDWYMFRSKIFVGVFIGHCIERLCLDLKLGNKLYKTPHSMLWIERMAKIIEWQSNRIVHFCAALRPVGVTGSKQPLARLPNGWPKQLQ